MAAVHSDLRVSTVSCGRAVPVFWKCSKPASRATKLGLGMPGTASRTRWAACGGCRASGGQRCAGGDGGSQGARGERRGQCRRQQSCRCGGSLPTRGVLAWPSGGAGGWREGRGRRGRRGEDGRGEGTRSAFGCSDQAVKVRPAGPRALCRRILWGLCGRRTWVCRGRSQRAQLGPTGSVGGCERAGGWQECTRDEENAHGDWSCWGRREGRGVGRQRDETATEEQLAPRGQMGACAPRHTFEESDSSESTEPVPRTALHSFARANPTSAAELPLHFRREDRLQRMRLTVTTCCIRAAKEGQRRGKTAAGTERADKVRGQCVRMREREEWRGRRVLG